MHVPIVLRVIVAVLFLGVPGRSAIAGSVQDPASRNDDAPDSASQAPEPHARYFLPHGLLYKSYLAGEKEPRFGAQWLHSGEVGWIWEAAVGTRFGIIRFGTGDVVSPEGWQLDIEGGVFTRVDIGVGTDVDAVDFRAGMLMTWRGGPTAVKAGMYHISAHIGDEYLQRNPGFVHLDYVRDSLIAGVTRDLTEAVSVYGELGYAYMNQGGADPFEVQFGIQYNPEPSFGMLGRPFAAVNGHLRQEFNFGGSVNAVTGWQWRSTLSGRVLRIGLQYFNGKALQYSFFDDHEEWLGTGMWFDF